jgi:hypothetical protein
MRHRLLLLAATVVATMGLAACSSGSTGAGSTTATTATPTTVAATAPPTTVVSERLAHWREVVQSMNCNELASLEKLRLQTPFNDQAESLVAIHDRQATLSCP